MATRLTNDLKGEYETLFHRLAIRPEHQSDIAMIQRRISRADNKQRYQDVEAATGVPWFVVAIIHNLESSNRFGRYLHNGDPLSKRTRRVPSGHPKTGGPPFTWQESAIDALKLKRFHKWQDWSVAGIAFILECYNGWATESIIRLYLGGMKWRRSRNHRRSFPVSHYQVAVFEPLSFISVSCGE